jgi:predicted nucleotidyltransferase
MLVNPEALALVVDFLAEHHISYMVIGGLANAVWGEVRTTRDADFKVSINIPLSEFRKLVFQHFQERQTSIPRHLQSAHVIHIWATPGSAVDLLVSIFDYERQAIARATETTIEGVPAKVCTAEDLIIHKAVADRQIDWRDIERILIRQRGKLDQDYIITWLRQFVEGLESPEILARYQQLQARYDPA